MQCRVCVCEAGVLVCGCVDPVWVYCVGEAGMRWWVSRVGVHVGACVEVCGCGLVLCLYVGVCVCEVGKVVV